MPTTKRPKALYRRGAYALYAREGRTNLEIVWYDATAGRERSTSARTGDLREGKLALDRQFLKESGHHHCPTCHRPWDDGGSPLLATVIADQLVLGEEKKGFKSSTRGRLKLALEYLSATKPTTTVVEVDIRWIDRYRKWLAERPVTSVRGKVLRTRSLSHIEQCVMQLAAVINATPGQKAQFTNEQPKSVAVSPRYRADVKTIAAMFRFCLEPSGYKVRSAKERGVYVAYRANLLAYLRAAVATWARPEEIFDLAEGQWIPSAGVLDLNQAGRRQTRKYRGVIPIPRQFAPFLDEMKGPYLSVVSVRGSWNGMRKELGLPTVRGEAGEKLIRRSMATIARRRIGEANWRQGEMMLGHVKTSISDIYALPDPANLGLALAATESIIDDIEKLAPGAFGRASDRAVLALVR